MKGRVRFHNKLYIGNRIDSGKLGKIKKMLAYKPLRAKAHLISVSNNSIDQLEIYDAKQLVQRYYLNHPPLVVGIATDYEEALELIQRIVEDCLSQRGDLALKEYLLCC